MTSGEPSAPAEQRAHRDPPAADHDFAIRQLRRALAARDQQLVELTAQCEQLRAQAAAMTAAERLLQQPGGPLVLALLRRLAQLVDRYETPRRLVRRVLGAQRSTVR